MILRNFEKTCGGRVRKVGQVCLNENLDTVLDAMRGYGRRGSHSAQIGERRRKRQFIGRRTVRGPCACA